MRAIKYLQDFLTRCEVVEMVYIVSGIASLQDHARVVKKRSYEVLDMYNRNEHTNRKC